MFNYFRVPFLFSVIFVLVACSDQHDQAAVVGACPVTQPNGSIPPGEDFEPRYHGNGKLWTALWPEGTVMIGVDGPGNINEDGSLVMSFSWWRSPDVYGTLEISGARLDGNAAPLQAEIDDNYNENGFQTSDLVFPSEGCWRITAAAGGASLTIVAYVAVMD